MSTITVLQTHLSMKQVSQSRRELLVFFGFLIPLTGVGYWLKLALHQPDYFLLWTPAMAAIVSRLVLRCGFSDVSFRFGGKRTLYAVLLALLFPLVVATIAYGMAWILGLAQFSVSTHVIPKPLPNPADPVVRFLWTVFLSTTLITLFYLVLFSGGEELGWRGFMLTRLVDARIPQPLFVCALIWWLWHVPFLLSGTYTPGNNPSLVLTLVISFGSIVAFNYFISWLRLRTGSIWPCLIAHAAWNAITQVGFNTAFVGPMSRIWIGESGIIEMLVLIVIVVAILRIWPLRQILYKPA
ncbi:MAG TPA: CPBP family intramembrane glutamic endopeptidase [Ktedonosporobacter sp.]|nr:CPBP family intramembrane glutamic endopeptidase [Ktedonosporobacter sp.]